MAQGMGIVMDMIMTLKTTSGLGLGYKSFNKNKPFNEFTIEQLAGDLLPNPANDS